MCGTLSAYVVIGIVPKEASGASRGFNSIGVYWSMSNEEHLGLFRSYLPHPNSKSCTVFLWTPCSPRNILSKFQKFSQPAQLILKVLA